MTHGQPCRGVSPGWGGGGEAVLSGKKCNSAKNYKNITEKFKNCTNFDMLVNRTSPPPSNNFGKRYSSATEMSVGHKLCHTLLVRQNKLTPHPIVIPRLRPCNHDDLIGIIWKSRFNSSGEEALFFRFQVKHIYQH